MSYLRFGNRALEERAGKHLGEEHGDGDPDEQDEDGLQHLDHLHEPLRYFRQAKNNFKQIV